MQSRISIVISVFLLFTSLNFAFAYTPLFPVPDTGQTTCYDDVGNVLDPCPAEGEPFYGQDANYTINPPSYTKLDAAGNDLPDSATDWVMVRDNVTGLIWEIKTNNDDTNNFDDPHDADNDYTWYDPDISTNGGYAGKESANDTFDFLSLLNTTNFGGFSDWRLPQPEELRSIKFYEAYPPINYKYFPNTKVYEYWTSITMADNKLYAWDIPFWYGDGFTRATYKVYELLVRAVRGNSMPVNDRFVRHPELGIVKDMYTGLIWEIKTDDGGLRDRDNNYNWQQALSYCENLNHAGRNDWRLPNINELASLSDLRNFDPVIDTSIFPKTRNTRYWSSTTYSFDKQRAVEYLFGSGGALNDAKYMERPVRSVRGGDDSPLNDYMISVVSEITSCNIGDNVSIEWVTASVDSSALMTIAMKRSSVPATQTEPDGVNWYIFTADTPNDGVETVTIPNQVVEADDWLFYVQFSGTEINDASNQSFSLNAPFTPILTVAVTSEGGGTIIGNGIECPADCEETYASNAVVTLTASTETGYEFTGWTGCDSVNGTQCTTTMTSAKTITASFTQLPPDQFALSTEVIPANTGTITGTGIACPTDCTENYTDGTTVTLTASPETGYEFTGWTGCDTVNGNQCTTTMTEAKTVTATFSELPPNTYDLNIFVDPPGSGSVIDTSAGITCPADCSETYTEGTTVILTAIANPGYVFGTWLICDSPSGNLCLQVINGSTDVLAIFEAIPTINSLTANTAHSSNSLSVQYTCDAQDADDGIDSYHWDMDGDGIYERSTAEGTEVQEYHAEGQYTISCYVTDVAGNDSTPQIITVNLPLDTDQDGLPDAWEIHGFDYMQDGTIDIDLPALGANPLKKDLFLWIEHMFKIDGDVIDCSLSSAAIERLKNTFQNRDISLHTNHWDSRIDYQEKLTFTDKDPTKEIASQITGSEFQDYHTHVYRRVVLAYQLFNESDNDGDSFVRGVSTLAGSNDAQQWIALSTYDQAGRKYNEKKQLVSLMHELGHSLGLGHGGPVSTLADNPPHEIYSGDQTEINDKPHYLSVMNYLYTHNGDGLSMISGGEIVDGILDYAVYGFEQLDKQALDETVGIFITSPSPYVPVGTFEDYQILFYRKHPLLFYSDDPSARVVVRGHRLGDHLGAPLDWNGDGSYSSQISENINCGEYGTELECDITRVLKADSDWDHLIFKYWNIGREPFTQLSHIDNRSIRYAEKEHASDGVCILSENAAERYISSYEFDLIPYHDQLIRRDGYPGGSVAFGFILTNSGKEMDTYTIAAFTENDWPVDIVADQSLAPGHRNVFQLIVHVPSFALPNTEELVTIKVQSHGNGYLVEGQNCYIAVYDDVVISDADNDGLTDHEESLLDLDPYDPDSDGDGIYDGIEVADGMSPDDRDMDGVIDALDTDNLFPLDSDGDGSITRF